MRDPDNIIPKIIHHSMEDINITGQEATLDTHANEDIQNDVSPWVDK